MVVVDVAQVDGTDLHMSVYNPFSYPYQVDGEGVCVLQVCVWGEGECISRPESKSGDCFIITFAGIVAASMVILCNPAL